MLKGKFIMKVFVSWSGELSCQIAEVLKKWIPCIIQSVDVFFSPEDIEKGDNWDKLFLLNYQNVNMALFVLHQTILLHRGLTLKLVQSQNL